MWKRQKRGTDLAAYAGQWVALANDRVIAAGTSLPSIMSKLPARKARQRPSVFLVPRQDEGPYVLVLFPRGC